MRKLLALAAGLLTASLAQAEEPNSRTLTETYQDWQVVCAEVEGKNRCEARQQLVNQNRQTVAVISVGKLNDKVLLQFALPHRVNLTEPVAISTDDQKPRLYPYLFCNAAACFVHIDGKDPLLELFKKHHDGKVQVVPLGQQRVSFAFSLKGFSAALARLMRE